MFTGERVGPQPCPHLVLDPVELQEIVDRLVTAEFVTVDVETDGLDERTNEVLWIGLGTTGQRYLIPISHPHGELLSAAWTEEVPDLDSVRPYKNNPNRFTKPKKIKVPHPAEFGPPPKQIRPDIVFRILEPLFFRHDTILVGHNLKFDLKSVKKYYGRIPEPPYVDTLVLLHLHDDNRTDYKLKPYICDWMLGKNSRKNAKMRKEYYPEVAKGGGIMTSSIDRVAAYLQLDITHTTRMYIDLMGRLPESLLDLLEAEMEVYEVVMEMEYDGINVDLSVIEVLDAEVMKSADAALASLTKHLGLSEPPDVRNRNVCRKLLFDPKPQGEGLTPIRFTKTGLPKLDKDVLKQLAAHNDTARYIREWWQDEKLHSTFTGDFGRFLHPQTKRVHATFKLHGTPTGRFSCEYPNLQQIPVRTERGRILRRAFIPAEGGSLVVADYDQIELRCIAYMAKDPEMIRLFAADEDIHAAAAAAMYGIDISEVTDQQRADGKTTNFAIGYGGGAERLANIFGVTLKQGEQMIANYYATYAGINPWKLEVIKASVATGERDTVYREPYTEIPPYNRRRRLPNLYSEREWDMSRAHRQAVNCVVQGFAAYILKQALINVAQRLKGLDARIVSQIHDELVIEVLDRGVEQEVYRRVIDGMESVSFHGQPALGPVPLRASGGIGPNWIEAKRGADG